MNRRGKNRRKNKKIKSLYEGLAGKHAVKNDKLYVKVHGVIHFEAAQRERKRVIFHLKPKCKEVLGLWKNSLKGQGTQETGEKPPNKDNKTYCPLET